MRCENGLRRWWSEDITEMNHGWRSAEYDGDDIEANLFPRNLCVASILAGGAEQAGLFLGADGSVGSSVFVGLPRFHFDENEIIVFPADQVDFAGAGSHTVVAGDDDDPLALQVTLGDVLSSAAKRVVRLDDGRLT